MSAGRKHTNSRIIITVASTAAAKRTCAPYWENGVLQVLKTFL